MTYLLRLPPSHLCEHSLPSSGLKIFPQEIRLDTMQRLHLSSPAGDGLANEKTRQAAAMLTSQELQLLRRPLTNPPVENLRGAARLESQNAPPLRQPIRG